MQTEIKISNIVNGLTALSCLSIAVIVIIILCLKLVMAYRMHRRGLVQEEKKQLAIGIIYSSIGIFVIIFALLLTGNGKMLVDMFSFDNKFISTFWYAFLTSWLTVTLFRIFK